MRENLMRTKLAAGEPCLNGWLSIGSSLVAESMAKAGFDAVTIDLQHGAISQSDLLPMLQAISTSDAVPLVRVPWNDPAACMQALDYGAYGLICPMIDTAEEAARFVGHCRYPLEGARSFGPVRGVLYGGSDYASKANAEILCIAMIETKAGLDNLDEILSVAGLDAIFVGPADLGQTLGLPPGTEWTDGPVYEALVKIVGKCRARGVPAGIFTKSHEYAIRMLDLGYAFTTIGSDLGYLSAGAAGTLGRFRDALGQRAG